MPLDAIRDFIGGRQQGTTATVRNLNTAGKIAPTTRFAAARGIAGKLFKGTFAYDAAEMLHPFTSKPLGEFLGNELTQGVLTVVGATPEQKAMAAGVPVVKSVGKTNFNISTPEGKKAYRKALDGSKTKMFQDDPALAALIPDPPAPPVPQLSLGEQLQQERDTLGLTPMQQWAKNFGGLANKVKDGQSGFNEIQAYFQAQDTGNTPKDQLAINTTGLETLIGPDGIGESKPGKPESFRSEKMAGNRIFNLINPVK